MVWEELETLNFTPNSSFLGDAMPFIIQSLLQFRLFHNLLCENLVLSVFFLNHQVRNLELFPLQSSITRIFAHVSYGK